MRPYEHFNTIEGEPTTKKSAEESSTTTVKSVTQRISVTTAR